MTLTGYTMAVGEVAEPENDSPTLRQFGQLAAEIDLTIAFGACLAPAVPGKSGNKLCVALPDGSARALYAKVHPFTFAGEHAVIEGGNQLAYLDAAGLRMGLSICYDLRFPELYAAMAPNCAAMLAIANWPARRVAHWRALLVARAIENQFYAIGVNRTGTDGTGLKYEKSSMVVTPDGSVLAPETASAELDIYSLDAGVVAQCRGSFPTLMDKRNDIYRKFFAHL
jgi:predicted amidohydrolase